MYCIVVPKSLLNRRCGRVHSFAIVLVKLNFARYIWLDSDIVNPFPPIDLMCPTDPVRARWLLGSRYPTRSNALSSRILKRILTEVVRGASLFLPQPFRPQWAQEMIGLGGDKNGSYKDGYTTRVDFRRRTVGGGSRRRSCRFFACSWVFLSGWHFDRSP